MVYGTDHSLWENVEEKNPKKMKLGDMILSSYVDRFLPYGS